MIGTEIKPNRFNMARIKGKDSTPELLVRRYLHSLGYRYRLHVKELPGKPDIVLNKFKTVIQVHGCFWHLHKNCKLNRMPKYNQEYWKPKLEGNVRRDQIHTIKLKRAGWQVLTIWECSLKKDKVENTFKKLSIYLTTKISESELGNLD